MWHETPSQSPPLGTVASGDALRRDSLMPSKPASALGPQIEAALKEGCLCVSVYRNHFGGHAGSALSLYRFRQLLMFASTECAIAMRFVFLSASNSFLTGRLSAFTTVLVMCLKPA